MRFRRSEAQEAAEIPESDTDDDDDFVQYPVVRDVQRPLIDFRAMDEITDKMAAAQQLRQALEAADLLVEEHTESLQGMRSMHTDQECAEQWEVSTFWRHAVGTQPAAEQVEATQQLRQALEAADSMEDPGQWEQCSECGDQESVCRLGRCVTCCKMAACGCASADWRDQMRARMQRLSDSDLGSDGQPQWYQDWCSSHQEGYVSGGSSDKLLPVQCAGCDDSFVLGGRYCSVCREDGKEAEARRFCVALVMKVDGSDGEEMEHTSCVMCRAEFCKLQ